MAYINDVLSKIYSLEEESGYSGRNMTIEIISSDTINNNTETQTEQQHESNVYDVYG